MFPYMEVVGSLICMAKFSRAAHGQRNGQLPCFFVWDVFLATFLLTFDEMYYVQFGCCSDRPKSVGNCFVIKLFGGIY